MPLMLSRRAFAGLVLVTTLTVKVSLSASLPVHLSLSTH